MFVDLVDGKAVASWQWRAWSMSKGVSSNAFLSEDWRGRPCGSCFKYFNRLIFIVATSSFISSDWGKMHLILPRARWHLHFPRWNLSCRGDQTQTASVENGSRTCSVGQEKVEPSGRNLGLLLETNQLVLWHANNTRRSRVQHVAVGEQTIVPRAGGVIVVHRDGLLVLMKRPSGNFFPPSNQVDLIFEKSGQLFYWALEFQIGA